MLKYYFNRWESLQEKITCYLFMKAKTNLHALGRFYNMRPKKYREFFVFEAPGADAKLLHYKVL
jgi:hypothetical protein